MLKFYYDMKIIGTFDFDRRFWCKLEDIWGWDSLATRSKGGASSVYQDAAKKWSRG